MLGRGTVHVGEARLSSRQIVDTGRPNPTAIAAGLTSQLKSHLEHHLTGVHYLSQIRLTNCVRGAIGTR